MHVEFLPAGFARRWLSLKAIGCHVTLLLLVPAFLLAAWWQAHRAAAGNTLSYLYVVEWPAFAAVAIWAWWQLIHLPPRSAEDHGGSADARWLRWDPSLESPELSAYNRYLAEINRTGQMTKPPRLGWRRRPDLARPPGAPQVGTGSAGSAPPA